jgi:hypothetical protein
VSCPLRAFCNVVQGSSCFVVQHVRGGLQMQQEAAGAVAALEERYWHAFNDLSLQLGTHLQERDATLAKVRKPVAWRPDLHYHAYCTAQLALPEMSAPVRHE